VNPSDTKSIADDDLTGEEEALEIDGTNTDQLDNAATRDPETTLDLLKALENAAIVIDAPAPPAAQPKREPGYNPYDTGPAKPKRK